MLSKLVDEIYAQRVVAAMEALNTAAQLEFKSYPKSRRDVGEHQVERLHSIVNGRIQVAYAGTSYVGLDSALARVGGTALPFQSGMPHDISTAADEVTLGRRALAYEAAVTG